MTHTILAVLFGCAAGSWLAGVTPWLYHAGYEALSDASGWCGRSSRVRVFFKSFLSRLAEDRR